MTEFHTRRLVYRSLLKSIGHDGVLQERYYGNNNVVLGLLIEKFVKSDPFTLNRKRMEIWKSAR